MTHTVGMSEMRLSNRHADILVTHSVGSCIALTLYDPVAIVGGMLHSMLPHASIDPARAAVNPEMFTDSGVAALVEGVVTLGAQKNRLVAKAAGASKFLDEPDTFQIGERNYVALRKALWGHGISIVAEDTGGTLVRTLFLYMSTGRTMIRARGEERELA